MRRLIAILLAAASPAAAQNPAWQAPAGPVPVLIAPRPAPTLTVWNPAASYITPGQDEPGYRSWYSASPRHANGVRWFNSYLEQYGVSGIVPTWQLLRTATSWARCGGQPFEVPPTSEWPHIVQTLRYIHAYVIPAVGPVEPVSAYRNPVLNACAGGAPESAHKHYSAIDLVPLRPTTREQLMRSLCAVHARRGTDYEVGLGFYAFLRFHVDTTKFRRWGAATGADGTATCPPIIRPVDIARVTPQVQPTTQPAAADAAPTAVAATPAPAIASPAPVLATPVPVIAPPVPVVAGPAPVASKPEPLPGSSAPGLSPPPPVVSTPVPAPIQSAEPPAGR